MRRRFDATTIDAQTAGLTLAEIRSVLELRNEGATPCSHVEALLSDKLADVRKRQRHLAALEHELVRLVERCATLNPADCRPDDICHIWPSLDAIRENWLRG